MIQLRLIPNVFENTGRRTVTVPFVPGKTVREYIHDDFGDVVKDATHVRVILSGVVLKDVDTALADHNEVVVVGDVRDPGTLMVIVHWAYVIATVAMTTYSIVQAVRAKQRAKSFNSNLTGGGAGFDDDSPTYGWDGIQNTMEPNRPVAIVLGEHMVGGQKLSQYVRSDGQQQFLHVLLGIGEGEIESVSDIRINDQPSANYSGITTYTRTGTLSQTTVPSFHELHNVRTVDVMLLQDDPHIYLTADGDITAFEVYITLPSGLYSQNTSNGSIQPWTVTLTIEYRVVGAGSWTAGPTLTISDKSRAAIRRIARVDSLTPGQYEVRVTRTSADSDFDNTGDTTWVSVDEIRSEALIYPGTALYGVVALATDQLSGQDPRFTALVKGLKVDIPDVRFGGTPIAWQDYYYDPATAQFKRFSDNGVCTWDGTTFINAWSANPVWCIRYLIINNRFGLGEFVTAANLNLAQLIEEAKYCEEKVSDGNGGFEKRWRLDCVIDSEARALDVLMQVCTAFAGVPIYVDGTVQLRADRPRTAVQLFGMGNIKLDSVKQLWKSVKSKPTEIDIQFIDKDKGYRNEHLRLISEAAQTAGETRRQMTARVFVTKSSYAVRAATQILNRERLINRTVTFVAGIDAVVATSFDRVDVSHDVPQWGFSGRVLTGSTTTTINLDRTVTIESGKTYKAVVRFADDTMQERDVTTTPQTTDTLTVTPAFSSAPAAYDVWHFGETNKVVKPFTIMAMRRTEVGEVDLSLHEYDEGVYSEGVVVVPQSSFSALLNETPDVENMTLTERIVKLNDGSIENVIDVWWQVPSGAGHYIKTFSKVRVFLSADDGDSWVLRAETRTGHYAIQGDIQEGVTYKVAVVSVSDRGEENALSASPQASITILGKTAPPSNVTVLDVSQQGLFLTASWPPVLDADHSHYVFQKGTDWSNGTMIAERIDATEFTFPVTEIGDQAYMVKAVDTSGNESVAPAVDNITVVQPPDGTFVQSEDLFGRNFNYERIGVSEVWQEAYDRTYMRKTLALTTATTWEEREAEALTWEAQEAASGLLLDGTVESSGSWEQQIKDAFDLGVLFDFKVIIDAQYLNALGGAAQFQISHSEDAVTWTAFATVSLGATYRARYVRFKVNLSTSNTAYNLWLYKTAIFINVPQVKHDYGRGKLIAVGGTTITFGPTFALTPRLTHNITNGVLGDIEVIAKSNTSVTYKVKDRSTPPVYIGTAELDWDAWGP